MNWGDVKNELIIAIVSGLVSGALSGGGLLIAMHVKMGYMERDIDRNRELIIRYLLNDEGMQHEQRPNFKGARQKWLQADEGWPRSEINAPP